MPRSRKASTATINFTVEARNYTSTNNNYLKKSSVAASNQFGGQSFVFGVTKDVTKPVIDGVASFLDLDVKEGTVIDQKFPYSTNNINQRFILSNAGIDLSTLEVYVRPSSTSSLLSSYTRQDSLFDAVTGSSITKILSFITYKRLKMSNMRSFLVMESSEKHFQTEILSKFRIF